MPAAPTRSSGLRPARSIAHTPSPVLSKLMAPTRIVPRAAFETPADRKNVVELYAGRQTWVTRQAVANYNKQYKQDDLSNGQHLTQKTIRALKSN